jgi:hypothetical protein
MKLKAPEGVGDPCVGGVTLVPRDGLYDVEPEVGALLIEGFGFVAVEAAADEPKSRPRRGATIRRGTGSSVTTKA